MRTFTSASRGCPGKLTSEHPLGGQSFSDPGDCRNAYIHAADVRAAPEPENGGDAKRWILDSSSGANFVSNTDSSWRTGVTVLTHQDNPGKLFKDELTIIRFEL